jgi:hypothetical protein
VGGADPGLLPCPHPARFGFAIDKADIADGMVVVTIEPGFLDYKDALFEGKLPTR